MLWLREGPTCTFRVLVASNSTLLSDEGRSLTGINHSGPARPARGERVFSMKASARRDWDWDWVGDTQASVPHSVYTVLIEQFPPSFRLPLLLPSSGPLSLSLVGTCLCLRFYLGPLFLSLESIGRCEMQRCSDAALSDLGRDGEKSQKTEIEGERIKSFWEQSSGRIDGNHHEMVLWRR